MTVRHSGDVVSAAGHVDGDLAWQPIDGSDELVDGQLRDLGCPTAAIEFHARRGPEHARAFGRLLSDQVPFGQRIGDLSRGAYANERLHNVVVADLKDKAHRCCRKVQSMSVRTAGLRVLDRFINSSPGVPSQAGAIDAATSAPLGKGLGEVQGIGTPCAIRYKADVPVITPRRFARDHGASVQDQDGMDAGAGPSFTGPTRRPGRSPGSPRPAAGKWKGS